MNLANLTNGAFWGIATEAPSTQLLAPSFIFVFPPFIPVVVPPALFNIFLEIYSREPFIEESGFAIYPFLILSNGSADVTIGVKYGN